jgi:hypothetical protein
MALHATVYNDTMSLVDQTSLSIQELNVILFTPLYTEQHVIRILRMKQSVPLGKPAATE